MPLGRIFRFIDRVTGDNAIGNVLGSAGRAIQRRSKRGAAPAAPTAPVPPIPGVPNMATGPVPTLPPDTFDNTGQAVGAIAGGTVGSAFGPAGTVIGSTLGGLAGEAIGNQISVPGSGGTNSALSNYAVQALAAGGRGKALLELMFYSGALQGIARNPIVYQGPNGRKKYGSDPGHVLISLMSGGQKIRFQMPKEIARKLGFWKPRKKPIISVRDSQAIMRAKRAKNRLEKAAKGSGLYVSRTPRKRLPAKTNTRRR